MSFRRHWLRTAILWGTGFQISRPEWLILETTNHCNQRCPVCGPANEGTRVDKGYFPRDKFTSLAAAASELRPQSVSLHARGEPLLHPHILELIEALHAKKLRTHLATNGLLLTPQLAEGLRAAGLDQLVVSYPGISKANYRASRGEDLPPSYETNLEMALQAWEGSDQDIVVRCMVLPDLLSDGPAAMANFLERWLPHPAVQRVEFTSYQPWPRHVREELLPGIHSKPKICGFTLDRLTMLWDGTLTPCSDDTRGELALGRWPQTTLRSAFNNRRVRHIRRAHMQQSAHRDPLCRNCWLPRMSTPIAFTARKEMTDRKGADLNAWLDRKSKKLWRLFNA